jgi:uroporphyrinogen decarboxylase
MPTLPHRSPLLDALARVRTTTVPVWFMRQAGRSLPEYRAVRGVDSILRVLEHPELAAEITLQPVRRYGVDAAILYSDIVAPLARSPIGIDIVPGIGPVVTHPVRSASDLARLAPLDPDRDLASMARTVELAVAQLSVPLIGFCGGPFTIASYLVEGRPSRTHERFKLALATDPSTAHALLERLVEIAALTIEVQVAHGARVVQIFDSWIGSLSPWQFRTHLAPHLEALLARLKPLAVPLIYFGVETTGLLDDLSALGIDAIALDWRTDLHDAARRFGDRLCLQGNLDPVLALAPPDTVLPIVGQLLEDSTPADGYIFNLGHGVLPDTDPGVLKAIVDLVHETGGARRRLA